MATHFSYYDDWQSVVLECPKCGWKGKFDEGDVERYDELIDSSCPVCAWVDAPMLAIVSYPTTDESRANWDKLSDADKKYVEVIERYRADFNARKLRDASQLPHMDSPSFVLHWGFHDAGAGGETLIVHGETVVFREPAIFQGYERFIEVAEILCARYGTALRDLVPTKESELYLYGDRLGSPEIVAEARQRIFPGAPGSG